MKFLSSALLLLLTSNFSTADACEPIDYLDMALPAGPHAAEIMAVLAAYPDLSFDADRQQFSTKSGVILPLGEVRDVGPLKRLASATIAEQFVYRYPLEFDLEQRKSAFQDPGRLRNDAFFRAIYFAGKKEARKSLARVDFNDGFRARFMVTQKRNVACQLDAVFADLSRMEPDFSKFFRKAGGSFNWRTISGTTRLSAHSFGIAVDLNTELGQYWKWSGAQVGNVGEYRNKFPEALVMTFERYGFIWGGKWHHYDGMHFEFRPEIILFSRMME